MKIVLARISQVQQLAQLDASRPFSAHWTSLQWQAELALPVARVWCVCAEEELRGFVALRGAAEVYEIVNLAVGAAYTRQGIGLALVQHALAQLRASTPVTVTLEVSAVNHPAKALYQHVGFTVVGRRKQFYEDGSDAFIMGITL